MPDESRVRYFHNDTCQQLNEILIDKGLGSATMILPMAGEHRAVCEILFEDAGGFSIKTENSIIKDVKFHKTDIGNLNIGNNNNVEVAYIDPFVDTLKEGSFKHLKRRFGPEL